MHDHLRENSLGHALGGGVVENKNRFGREARAPVVEDLEGKRIELDRFRILTALEIVGRAPGETKLVGAVDVIVGQGGVMAGEHVPVEFQEILVVIDGRALRANAARIKSILVPGDVDNVLDAAGPVESKSRGVSLNRNSGAFAFVAENEEEHVFENRTGGPGAVSVFMESRDRLPDGGTVADQILIAPKAVKRSVELIVT